MARIRPVWASVAAATRSAPPPLHHMRLAVRLVRNPPEAVPRLRDGQAQAEAAHPRRDCADSRAVQLDGLRQHHSALDASPIVAASAGGSPFFNHPHC
jgi:hypothetical protein